MRILTMWFAASLPLLAAGQDLAGAERRAELV